MNCDVAIAATRFSKGGIRACCHNCRYRIDVRNTNVLKHDYHEAAPDGCAIELHKGECGILRNLGLAATDGFLKQAADDPRISGDQSARGYRIGIDLAGEPLLGLAKCIAHDVLENLISRKTLAFARSIASEMYATVKK